MRPEVWPTFKFPGSCHNGEREGQSLQSWEVQALLLALHCPSFVRWRRVSTRRSAYMRRAGSVWGPRGARKQFGEQADRSQFGQKDVYTQ